MGGKSLSLALLALFAGSQFAADTRDWNEGAVNSIQKYRTETGSLRYQYVICVGNCERHYIIQYNTPIKAHRRDSVKFTVDGDRFIVLDIDGKKRPSPYDFTTVQVVH